MTPLEVGKILTFARVYDSRRPEVLPEDARAWHRLFAEVGLEDLAQADAEAAVVAHYGDSTEWLMPSHIVQFCKSLRRQRIRELNASGQLEAMIRTDPTDLARWQAERAQIIQDVAAGRRALPQMEAGR